MPVGPVYPIPDDMARLERYDETVLVTRGRTDDNRKNYDLMCIDEFLQAARSLAREVVPSEVPRTGRYASSSILI